MKTLTKGTIVFHEIYTYIECINLTSYIIFKLETYINGFSLPVIHNTQFSQNVYKQLSIRM